MYKEELVKKIADSTGLAPKQAKAAVEAGIDAVWEELVAGGSITLIGFGTLKSQKRAKRKAYDFRTGEMAKIPAKNTAVFNPSPDLKAAMNPEKKKKRGRPKKNA